MFPHSFRIQQKDNSIIKNVLCKDKNLLLHGEEHFIAFLSAKLYNFINKINKKNFFIFFTIDQKIQHDLFSITKLKKYLLPYLDTSNYMLEEDGMHMGSDYQIDFAKLCVNFLKRKKIL